MEAKLFRSDNAAEGISISTRASPKSKSLFVVSAYEGNFGMDVEKVLSRARDVDGLGWELSDWRRQKIDIYESCKSGLRICWSSLDVDRMFDRKFSE